MLLMWGETIMKTKIYYSDHFKMIVVIPKMGSGVQMVDGEITVMGVTTLNNMVKSGHWKQIDKVIDVL